MASSKQSGAVTASSALQQLTQQQQQPITHPKERFCNDCQRILPNQIAYEKIEYIISSMQDDQTGLPVKTAKSFMSKIPSVFTGSDLIQWMMRQLKLEDQQEAIHLANLIASYGYIFPIEEHTFTIKNDATFYRFQTPCLWPSKNQEPENTDYAVYLCKRTMQGKTRLELADYEAENLARLQKMFSRKWEFIFMQAEAQAKVDKKRDKLERKVLDSQERAFWDVYRPVPGTVNTTELDIKKACRLSKSAKKCNDCRQNKPILAAGANQPAITSTLVAASASHSKPLMIEQAPRNLSKLEPRPELRLEPKLEFIKPDQSVKQQQADQEKQVANEEETQTTGEAVEHSTSAAISVEHLATDKENNMKQQRHQAKSSSDKRAICSSDAIRVVVDIGEIVRAVKGSENNEEAIEATTTTKRRDETHKVDVNCGPDDRATNKHGTSMRSSKSAHQAIHAMGQSSQSTTTTAALIHPPSHQHHHQQHQGEPSTPNAQLNQDQNSDNSGCAPNHAHLHHHHPDGSQPHSHHLSHHLHHSHSHHSHGQPHQSSHHHHHHHHHHHRNRQCPHHKAARHASANVSAKQTKQQTPKTSDNNTGDLESDKGDILSEVEPSGKETEETLQTPANTPTTPSQLEPPKATTTKSSKPNGMDIERPASACDSIRVTQQANIGARTTITASTSTIHRQKSQPAHLAIGQRKTSLNALSVDNYHDQVVGQTSGLCKTNSTRYNSTMSPSKSLAAKSSTLKSEQNSVRASGGEFIANQLELLKLGVGSFNPNPSSNSASQGNLNNPNNNNNQQQQTASQPDLESDGSKGTIKINKVTESYVSYFQQWAEYDPFIEQPIPSNPWISDSTEFWESEKQTKDVHLKRVRRWTFSLKELLNDPAGREQFYRFLEKEFSAENLKFWDAVQDLKRVHARDVGRRIEAIWKEYLAQDANCPINIDSKSYETSKRNMDKNRNNRYIFDEAAGHVYQLMKNDSYPRYLRSDMYKEYREASEKRRTNQNQVTFDVFKPQISNLKQRFNFN